MVEKQGTDNEENEWENEDCDDWDNYGAEDDQEMSAPIYSGEVQTKGYEQLTMDTVRKKCLIKMEDLVDMYNLSTDDLLLVARHYQWNEELMQNDWFKNQDKLIYTLGIEFDKSIS